MQPSGRTNYCDNFQYDFDQNISLSVVFGVCFLVGIFMVFTGYRLFRTSLFVQTLSLTSVVTYLLVSNLLDKSVPVNGAIAAASGLLLGIFSMFATTLGLLITSLIQSVYIATCILYGVHEFVEVKNVFVAPTITLVVFVLLSVPIIKWPRVCSIIYICSFGAILMMLSVDFYADLSMLRLMAFENVVVRGEKTVRPCWFSWTVLALWPLMLFVGCVVQFLKTARDFDHRHEPHWYKRNKPEPKTRLLSNKSDVIAQAWMQPPPISPLFSENKHPFIGSSQYSTLRDHHAVEDEVFLVQDTTTTV